jgi:hypothetical protein
MASLALCFTHRQHLTYTKEHQETIQVAVSFVIFVIFSSSFIFLGFTVTWCISTNQGVVFLFSFSPLKNGKM